MLANNKKIIKVKKCTLRGDGRGEVFTLDGKHLITTRVVGYYSSATEYTQMETENTIYRAEREGYIF